MCSCSADGPRISRMSCGRHGAFGELLAFLHDVAGIDDDVAALRDEVFLFAAVFVGDDDLALAADEAADFDGAVDAAISQASFGRRASKSSATRGRPPVMSLVLAILRGVLASRVPPGTFLPSCTARCAPAGIGVAGEDLLLLVLDDDLRVEVFLVLDDDDADDAGGLRPSSFFTVTP